VYLIETLRVFADVLIIYLSMDSRVAILGANGTGKSTLLHLITGVLQPCEGTVSKHISLKLAKYSQHSADQLPYEKTPIEYLDSLYREKMPEKDMMVGARFKNNYEGTVY
jgi:ATP-binding cassette, subfamily F, member 2